MDIQREQYLDKTKYTLFRLDGHHFSKFTSTFKKPFDEHFTNAMKQTALQTFNEFSFSIGFVGSDEMTFCICPKKNCEGDVVDINHNGRIQKMTTLLAGYVSVVFYKEISKTYQTMSIPYFDCRVFQVDTYNQMLEKISERITYTLKNSKMMFSQSELSHKQLHNLSSTEAINKVLNDKNLNFYELVDSDVRVGCVIVTEKETHIKKLNIKGVEKEIRYTRNVPKCINMSPTEMLEFNI